MQLRHLLSLTASLTLIATQVNAQTPVGALQDLVGARASSGEAELERRGYQFLRTDKSAAGVYMYWRESSSRKCVTVQVEDGRYQSLVYAPDFDCQQTAQSNPSPSSHPPAGTPVAKLKDLVGARAGQAENAITSRGYQFLKNAEGGFSYWREAATGYCVTIRTEQGRYQSIVYATLLDCN